jgi:hypothetical protein
MSDEDRLSRIERLKIISREFFVALSGLRKKRDTILEAYETLLEEKTRDRLRRKIDDPSV